MSATANDRAPKAKYHYTDAEGCKSFAVNAHFAFVFGTEDKSNNATKLTIAKTRRVEGSEAVICKINGDYSEFILAPDLMLDSVTRKFVYFRGEGQS